MKQTNNEVLRGKLYKLAKKLCKITGTQTSQAYQKAFEVAVIWLVPSIKKVTRLTILESEWEIVGATEPEDASVLKVTCYLTTFSDIRLQAAVSALETEIAAWSTCTKE